MRMKMIRQSSLGEYAEHFWRRERPKDNQKNRSAFSEIDAGCNKVKSLEKYYPYKLPFGISDPAKVSVEIWHFEVQEDVESLLVHKGILCDDWMKDRKLVPDPFTQRLGDLAKTFSRRGYFSDSRWSGDGHFKNFQKWVSKNSLQNAIDSKEKPLLEKIGESEFEIVDGWGRLVPFVALVHEHMQFFPFETFVASKN